MIKFENNTSDKISHLEIYSNAHLFQLDPEKRQPFLTKIALGCGAGVTDLDLKYYDGFAKKVLEMTEFAT